MGLRLPGSRAAIDDFDLPETIPKHLLSGRAAAFVRDFPDAFCYNKPWRGSVPASAAM
jgi:hypothetical protein